MAVISLLACLQLSQWPLTPRFLDAYYHLSVADGFLKAGGYVGTAVWEYAPAGRPHLYPPLIHFAMAGLRATGLQHVTVARVVESMLFPALLAALWLVVRGTCSRRMGFLAVLAGGSSFTFYLAAETLPPFTLAMILGLLALLAMVKGRIVAAGLLLCLCFYSHTLMAWMSLGAVLLSCAVRRQFRAAAVACGVAIVPALPILLHQFRWREFFQFVVVRENRVLELDPLLLALASIGLVVALRRRGGLLIPVSLALSLASLAFTHRVRALSGHGIAASAWLAAVALDRLFELMQDGRAGRRAAALSVVLLTVLFLLAAPVVHWNTVERTVKVAFFDRSVAHFTLPDELRVGRVRENPVYFPNEFARIVRIVEEVSEPDDLIWSDFSQGAGILGLLSGRATSSAMMAEVRPFRADDPLASTRVLIWFKKPDRDVRPWILPAVDRYGLQLAGETGMAFIFVNPAVKGGRRAQRADVPWVAVGSALFMVAALAVLDSLRPGLLRRLAKQP